MSNKIYKSKMKDENRLLGKFVIISLIALLIIFVLLFLKIIVDKTRAIKFKTGFSVYDFTDKVSGKGIACRCGINGFYRENALCAAFGVIAIHGTFFAEGEHNFAIRKFVNQSVQQSSAIRVFSKGSTRFF